MDREKNMEVSKAYTSYKDLKFSCRNNNVSMTFSRAIINNYD